MGRGEQAPKLGGMWAAQRMFGDISADEEDREDWVVSSG